MLEHGFSFDFLALCDPSRIVTQLRNWVRFSDNDHLAIHLKKINGFVLENKGWQWKSFGPLKLVDRRERGAGYWNLARSLILREIGGNEYIDIHGDAKFALPALPLQRTDDHDERARTLFRDTLKIVCSDGQDATNLHLNPTKFDRSCTDNVGFGIFGGAEELRLRHVWLDR